MSNFWLHFVLSLASSALLGFLQTADPKFVPIVTQLISDIQNLLDLLVPPPALPVPTVKTK